MKTDNGTVSLGRIENLKLFTEYERQLKRKYPCSHPAFKEENLEFSLCFEHLVKGVIYNFKMIAPNPPRNGDVECKVYLDNHPNKTMQFEESRKPMEMNVDNLITAATVLANQEN